ncbi:uncharacterized protein LOC125946570 [Dermacentor silvarum]|uniref:uncharacterized protein LOC125946570 n=1 Tax=Dermacentor silvarum TaxID=543639 RepID=UPI002100DF08|nr:uncharacterized protein LOC125946570 [Dermacentor silvarum]
MVTRASSWETVNKMEAVPVTGVTRLRFTEKDDLALLSEVNACNPLRNPSKWQEITKNIELATKKVFSGRTLRERCKLLLAHFAKNDRACLRKSGTEEEYAENEWLLQEISQLAAEVRLEIGERRSSNASQRSRAAAVRHGAVAALQSSQGLTRRMAAEMRPMSRNVPTATVSRDGAAANHDTTSPVQLGSSCSPAGASALEPPESATQLFNIIFDGNDVCASSCALIDPYENTQCTPCEAVASTGYTIGSSETAAPPEWDESGDMTMPRIQTARRRRRPQAQPNADHEFLEKRWRHKSSIRVKEIALDMERIQVEKAEQERKKLKTQKKYEIKQYRMEKDFLLREQELKLRADELQHKQGK